LSCGAGLPGDWALYAVSVRRLIALHLGLHFGDLIGGFVSTMVIQTTLYHFVDAKKSNPYFLSGNFISILLAMISSIIVKAIWKV
jgi:hypothetical protein